MEDILRLAQQKLDINRTDCERDAEPLQDFEIRQGEADRRNTGMAENRKKPEQRQPGRDIHTDRAETEWKPGMGACEADPDRYREGILWAVWQMEAAQESTQRGKTARTGAGNADAVGSDVCG